MNDKIKQKMEYVAFGYAFVALNLLATISGYAIVGIGFGFMAGYLFIKAIRVK